MFAFTKHLLVACTFEGGKKRHRIDVRKLLLDSHHKGGSTGIGRVQIIHIYSIVYILVKAR
jgi:hypothetical protein